MFIISLGIVIILSIIIKIFIFQNNNVEAPLCKNGFLDLSHWDFEASGRVKLNGQWEFYPNVLLSPKDINNKVLSEKLYINVPNPWTKEVSKNILSNRGIGTYRLKVRINKDLSIYGLITEHMRSANKIFVNGREIAKSGNVESSFKGGYSSNVVPVISMFPSYGDTLDIIIQVANSDYYNGGIIQNIYLGSYINILDYYFKINIFKIVCIAFLMMFGIYYIRIYFITRKEKILIYFGISCIIYSCIFAIKTDKIFNKLSKFIPFIILLKTALALICLIVLFICLFIRENGKIFIPDKYMKVITLIVSINIFLVLMLPTRFMALLENIIVLMNTLLLILVSILMIKALVNKEYGRLNVNGTMILFFGIILNIVQYVNYILYFFSITNNNFIPLIILLFVLIEWSTMFLDQYVQSYLNLEVMRNNLIKLDKIKDEILLNTSHEFKTPLHTIINIAEAMRNEKETLKFEKNLSNIISIATKLSSLVNDIIDFEYLQNGNIKFNKKTFDINGSIQMVIDILGYMKKGEDIQLINTIPVGKYYVYTDENRFKQIIFNLIGNSLKYTGNGYVKVSAKIIDNYVYVSFEDTGLGIDKNTQKSLFVRKVFYKESDFIKGVSPELGLSISKLLARNMGGDLYLKHSELNKGSIFNLKIPKVAIDKSIANNTQNVKFQSKGTTTNIAKENKLNISIPLHTNGNEVKKVKLLIVDDDASDVMVMKEIFYESHYEVIVAYDGKSALKLMHKHKNISIILLDAMMPGLSGYNVCKKIRENYKIFELPILLITVTHTPEEIEAGLEVGVNDFLVKPFNSNELKSKVKTLLKLKEAVNEMLKIEAIFLQSQIKPHFLYNSLSTIISLCYSDGERAGKLLGELSNFLRLTFTIDPFNSFVSLKRELSLVKSYIEIEKARFGDRLKTELNIDEKLLEYKIPALVIQPIVENSIRHGLMKRISGGIVKIAARKSKNFIEITIDDNGVGIEKEVLEKLLDNTFTTSIGLKNVNKRLLNKYGQGLLITSDLGVGTSITIKIPIEVEN
ncbi:response regulator [Clostridium sp. PL3]|uniref:Response regulator n=1 Tax=Clostridium thailandense TaxID=2794346 RepID=A0A949WRZ0_9CLOT|nr:response regulator [Clostridium thailandense]